MQTALKAPAVWRGGPAPVFWHTGDEDWQKRDGVRYARSVTTVVHIDLVIHALDIAWQKFLVVYPSLAENIPAPPSATVFSALGKQTECFVRFSTVAGERGAADAERDVRGFAVKFYTEAGNWDLVGNNTPVFFVRDPYKFPDFIRTQKRDRRRLFCGRSGNLPKPIPPTVKG